jgi:hypothetical protein
VSPVWVWAGGKKKKRKKKSIEKRSAR